MTSKEVIRCQRCHKLSTECQCAEGVWTKEMVDWDRYVCNDMNSEVPEVEEFEIDWKML